MKKLAAFVCLVSLAACVAPPESAFKSRGGPESLLVHSNERVNLILSEPRGMEEMTSWIDKDQPTKVALACVEGSLYCAKAIGILQQFGLPYSRHLSNDGQDQAMLMYDRVVARDCDNRFVDNYTNPYNAPQPAFGCSMSANTVQMITDRKEITNPATMPKADGRRAAQVMKGATQPNNYSPAAISTEFESISASE